MTDNTESATLAKHDVQPETPTSKFPVPVTDADPCALKDSPHLDAQLRDVMAADDVERTRFAQRHLMVIYPTLAGIINEISWLVEEPIRERARGLVLCANPGSGKTALMKLIQKTYPVTRLAGNGHDGPDPCVVAIQASGARTTKSVLDRILDGTKAPITRNFTIADREIVVVETLRRMNCRLLILDEAQDLARIPPREQIRVLEVIKYLMNTLCMPLFALGTDKAEGAFQSDEHLMARLDFIALPPWTVGTALGTFLQRLERFIPLKRPSNLGSDTAQKVLVENTEGNLDKMMIRIRVAAAAAIKSGEEKITAKALAAPVARPSIEVLRRHAA